MSFQRSGPRGRPPQGRQPDRRVRWVLAATAAIGATVLLLAGLRLRDARDRLLHGATTLQAARATIHSPSDLKSAEARRSLRLRLVSAMDDLQSAHDDLAPLRGIVGHLNWIPRYGGELAAAAPATDVALDTVRASVALLDGLQPVWPELWTAHSRAPLLVRATPALARGAPKFREAVGFELLAGIALRGIAWRTGNSALDSALARLRSLLPPLISGSRWLASAPDLLGMRGPRRYLVLLQNPAELRATGGFIGAADIVTFDRGQMRTAFTNSALPPEIDTVPPPLPESLYTPEAYWLFRDSNWSPDFPLSARLARWFYGEDTGVWVDGVAGAIDPLIVPVLEGTGPIHLSRYGLKVNAANVARLAQMYVHGSAAPSGPPKVFLGTVIDAILHDLQRAGLAEWTRVGQVLAEASQRRDVMLWAARRSLEAAVKSSDADGSLQAPDGDILAVVDDNRSYNKINPYVREEGRYRVRIESNGSADCTLGLIYRVLPSPSSLEGGGPFGVPGATKHDYQDFLRVYVPAGATLLSFSGADRWLPARAYGMTQFAGRLVARQGQRRLVTIRYRLPPGSVGVDGRYVLNVRHQPGADLDSLSVLVDSGATRVARDLSLTRDARLTTDLHVAGQVPARVPDRKAEGDPYVPYGFMRDRRHPFGGP